jgi:hypothetical protein
VKLRRSVEATGIRAVNNSVSFMTQWAHVTAIVDEEGDVLLSTSYDVRPTLSFEELTQFYGAVKALKDELKTNEKKD